MTQYLMSVLDDTTDSATAEEMAEIDAFNEHLDAEGHWVFAGGLASPSTATVVDGWGGEGRSLTGHTWSRRSTSAASGSSGPPTSTWRFGSPPWGRSTAIGGSNSGRSWAHDRR